MKGLVLVNKATLFICIVILGHLEKSVKSSSRVTRDYDLQAIILNKK